MNQTKGGGGRCGIIYPPPPYFIFSAITMTKLQVQLFEINDLLLTNFVHIFGLTNTNRTKTDTLVLDEAISDARMVTSRSHLLPSPR